MEKKIIAYGILLLFFLATFSYSVEAYVYDASFYMSDQTNPSNSLFAPSHYSSGTCNLTITGKDAFNTSSSVDVSMIYYSPGTTTISTYTNNGITTNQTCMNMGSPHTTSSNGSVFEMDSTLTHSGTASDIRGTVTSRYQCSTSANWIELYSDKTHLDLRSLQTGGYQLSVCLGSQSTQYYIEEPQFQECNAVEYSAVGNWLYGIGLNTSDRCTLGQWEENFFVYPFMSGETGEVMYDFTVYKGVGLATPNNWILRYYKMENASTNVTINSTIAPSDAGTPVQGHLYLEPNTQYAFQLVYSQQNPVAAINHPTPDANISIMVYEPDWDCTDWSECENGYQSRTCTDPAGVANDKIESRGCLPDVTESIYLGFEDYRTEDDIRKCIRSWFCSWTVQNITTYYPLNWEVYSLYRRYMVTVSGEWASGGSKSLKMWGIPAYMQIPATTFNGSCENSTLVDYPATFGNITNESAINRTWVSLNVTFPSTYMQIRYDHKVCTQPAYKSDNYWCRGADYNETDICYAKNGFCNASLKGRYCVRLWNADDVNDVIVEHCGFSNENSGTDIMDVSEMGINVSKNYTLSFIMEPEDPTSTESNCMYFDEVYLEYLNSELTCQEEPYCDGNDRIIPILYNESCVYKRVSFHEACFDSTVTNNILNKLPFCDPDTNEYHEWNNETNEWESTENATNCQGAGSSGVISGLAPIGNFITSTLGFGEFNVMFSIYGLSFIIAICVGAAILWLGKDDQGKVSNSVGMFALFVVLGLLGLFALFGLFFPEFAFLLILIGGYIFVKLTGIAG